MPKISQLEEFVGPITTGQYVPIVTNQGTRRADATLLKGQTGDPGQPGSPGAPGQPGQDGHSPILTWSGDQISIDGIASGPHLTGPQGQQGDPGPASGLLAAAIKIVFPDVSNSTTTMTSIPALEVPLEANSTYLITVVLILSSQSNGIAVALDFSATPQYLAYAISGISPINTTPWGAGFSGSGINSSPLLIAPNPTHPTFSGNGIIKTGAQTGNAKINFRSGMNGQSVSVMAGSMILVEKWL